MRVNIGPYKNWIGPYQIADKVPFISGESKDKLGDWLSQFKWLVNLCQKIYDWRGERKIDVRIDAYDTWSMDHTLAHIILPMFKQLKATKQGSGYVDDEDLPPEMRHDGEEWVHYKWDWALNEMIFAFENIVDSSWEDKFYHGEPEYEWNLISGEEGSDNAIYESKQINPDFWIDVEGIKAYNKRIDNGTRLFGKYFRSLWD